MCMLTVIPAGHVPNVDGIYNGTLTNDDGHGFAIVVGSRVRVFHSMSADQTVTRFEKMRRAHPEGPALFHSRWATHGRVDESNCHPFKVGGDRKTVLAHNGVLSGEAIPRKGDPRSDTKKYAQDIFPVRFARGMDSEAGRKAHEAWLGSYNKVAVITANPAYAKSLYILNESKGIWSKDGNWYSNSDYLPYVPIKDRHVVTRLSAGMWGDDWSPTGGWGYSSTDDRPSVNGLGWPTEIGGTPAVLESVDSGGRWPHQCPWCFESDSINHVSGTCERCNTCLDCVEPLSTCLCYVPGGEHGRNTVDSEPCS